MCCSRALSRHVHKTGLGRSQQLIIVLFQNFRQAPRTFDMVVSPPWWGDQINASLVRISKDIAQLCL